MVLKLRQLLKCHLAGILPYMSIAGYPSLRFIPGYQVGADLAKYCESIFTTFGV